MYVLGCAEYVYLSSKFIVNVRYEKPKNQKTRKQNKNKLNFVCVCLQFK